MKVELRDSAFDPLAELGSYPTESSALQGQHGATAIFGPGTVVPVAAEKILVELSERLGH